LRYPYEVRKEDEYFDEISDEKIPKDMLDLAKRSRGISMAEGRAFLEQLPVSAADKERIAHGNAWGAVTLKAFACSRALAFYRPSIGWSKLGLAVGGRSGDAV
jgi:hypothetical protein